MSNEALPERYVAIVDYGMGNLFSVRRACERAGLTALVTSDKNTLLSAVGVILPGVGAFGDAMATLSRFDLVAPLKEVAARGTPLLGICLGMQLLMTESSEFGNHQGLGLIEGRVVRFERPLGPHGPLKVPQIGWNSIYPPNHSPTASDPWARTLLSGIATGAYMYFVHSHYVCPATTEPLSTSAYGHIEFCSALAKDHITACQFHPEKSGPAGLQVYRTFADLIGSSNEHTTS